MDLTETLAALVGFAIGVLLTFLVKMYIAEDHDTDAYRQGYEAAQAEQRQRNEARARKAAQTRRAKS